MAPGSLLYVFDKSYSQLLVPLALSSWVLLVLLITPVMQRRATPEAAIVRFANPLAVIRDPAQPRSVAFAIDHAPEDGRYAEDLRRGLERYGHRLVPSGERPEAVFVLLSTYKKDTEYDPDQQAVYPVLLQAVGEIAPKLQRIQWLDFRRGIGNTKKLARLLPEPERLLKVLGVAPTGSQEIFPLSVNALQYFYLSVGGAGLGSLLFSILSVESLILQGQRGTQAIPKVLTGILYGIFLFGVVLYSVRGLRARRGGTAAIYPLLVLTLFQLIIYLLNFFILWGNITYEDRSLVGQAEPSAAGTVLVFYALFGVFLIILPFVLLGWRDLYRWLPRRQDAAVGRLESALLLYTPLRKRALVFHILFHLIVLFVLFIFLLGFIIAVGAGQANNCWLGTTIALVPIALACRWQARRMST